MTRHLWIGAVAAIVFLVVMLFAKGGSIFAAIASLLLFVDAALLLGAVLLEQVWGSQEVLFFFVSIFLFVAVIDKLVVNVYADFLNLAYVILFAVAVVLLRRKSDRVSFAVPVQVKNMSSHRSSVSKQGKKKSSRTSLLLPVHRRRIASSKARRRFILDNFQRKRVDDVRKAVRETVSGLAVRAVPSTYSLPATSLVSLPLVGPQNVFPSASAFFQEEKMPHVFPDLFQATEPRSVVTHILSPPAIASEEPEQMPVSSDVFIVSTNGARFHLPTCMIVKRIPQEKKAVYTNPVEVVKGGFVPCGVCNPLKRT